MAFYPSRSWAITYNQMWNLSMKDPIPRGSNQFQRANFQHTQGSSNGTGHTASEHRSGGRKKSDYCWNFNKGVPCKFGAKCKFIERCKYCDSPSHGVNNCVKLQKKNEGNKAQEVTK